MTRSLPLARPSRASAFGRIPFAASHAAKVLLGEERETEIVDRLSLLSWGWSTGRRNGSGAGSAARGVAAEPLLEGFQIQINHGGDVEREQL